MRCQACSHTNPPGSKYCNQCGTKLAIAVKKKVTAEEIRAQRRALEFEIPGSAAGQAVPWGRIAFNSVATANAAFRAVGAFPVPELDVRLKVPGVGVVVRTFGVLGNNIEQVEETDAEGTQVDLLAFDPDDLKRFVSASESLRSRALRILRHPDNERVLRKLESGKLRYLPVNRVLAKRIEQDIAPLGLHLPWSVNQYDVGFGRKCRDVLGDYGFVCYYGHLGRAVKKNGEATFRRTRMTSIPFGVDGYHTWEAAISDELVDEDVALLIEAEAHPD